jgi:adenylate kinase family enzyme
MGKIILVSGYPAAGKSTFSRELSRRLAIPCFNKDLIKETIADSFGIENEELLNRDKKASVATFSLLLHIAEQFLQTGKPCILESNFQAIYPVAAPEMQQIQSLLAKYDCECLTFLLKGDPTTISERYFYRRRHWTHGQAPAKDTIKHYCIANRLDEFEIGKTIPVDTTDFANVDYEKLYEIARRFIEGG